MSTELQTNRSESIIALEINMIKEQTNKILLSSSIEIGKRLLEAKEIVGHGNWTEWLDKSVNYSQRTAQNLIKIYEEFGKNLLENGENSNTQALADLGYTQAVAMLKLDFESRESFIEEHDITTMTTRELESAIADKIALQKEKDTLLLSVNKMVEENESLRKQINETEDLQKKLDELKKNKIDPKDISRLEEQLGKSKAEVEKLKKSLADAKAATTMVEVDKEVIPKEVVEEMEKMRTKLAMGESTVRFKALFDTIVTLFNEMVVELEKIKVNDHAVHEKYKEATNKMLEQLKQ